MSPSLRTLMRQITEHDPEAEVEVVDERDGFGVYRSLKVDAATAKWLGKALDVIKDPRVASIKKVKGSTVITVVADTRADSAKSFPLAEVDSILSE